MPRILAFQGVTPRIHSTATIFAGAIIIGDVEIGAESSVWFNCVVRGDVHHIRIGERSNIQDLSMLHVTWKQNPLIIGNDVTVGHSVTLHGCTVHDRCLIGMGAVVLDRCDIGEDSIVAAGSLVLEGTVVPPRTLVAGSPAKVKRGLRPEEIERLKLYYAGSYVKYARAYKGELDEKI